MFPIATCCLHTQSQKRDPTALIKRTNALLITMSLPANYSAEAVSNILPLRLATAKHMIQLNSVNNSTDVTGLVSIVLALPSPTVAADQHTQLESLTNLVQNITNFLPTLLAQSQENNRALAHLCSFTEHQAGTNFCSVGSNVVVPSILGMGISMVVVFVVQCGGSR